MNNKGRVVSFLYIFVVYTEVNFFFGRECMKDLHEFPKNS